MRSSFFAYALAVLALTGIAGCGNNTTAPGLGFATVAFINPPTFSGASTTPFVISGFDYSQVVGTAVIVRFTATSGTPFFGGTTDTFDVPGFDNGATEIIGDMPPTCVEGGMSVEADIIVIFPSGFVTQAGKAFFEGPMLAGGSGNFTPGTVPSDIPQPFTVDGTNLGDVGDPITVRFEATGGATVFAGGTSSTVDVAATVTATGLTGTTPLAVVCGIPDPTASITVILTNLTCSSPPPEVSSGGPVVTFEGPVVSGLDVAGFAPNEAPTTVLLGSGTPESFTLTGTNFAPNGANATVTFSRPGIFDLGASSVDVIGTIVNATTITGALPTITSPRLTADMAVNLHVTLPSGSCTPTVLNLVTLLAPPTITSVVNNRAPFDQTTTTNPIPNTWLNCVATDTTINGVGFDAGITELFHDAVGGVGAPIGAGQLTADPSPAGTARMVTGTTITGWSPRDGSITDPTTVSLRVVNPDQQWHGITGLTWETTGVLPNVNAATIGGNQAEMQIAVNPTNPLNAAVCAHHSSGGYVQMTHSFTTDGGATWTQFFVGPSTSAAPDGFADAAFRFDPMCAFDRFGNYYCVYGVDPGGIGGPAQPRSIVVQRSTDRGATFNPADVTILNFPASTGLDRWTVDTGPDGVTPDLAGSEVLMTSLVDFATGDILLSGLRIQTGPGPNGEGGTMISFGTVTINDVPLPPGHRYQHGTPSVGPLGEIYVSYIDGDTGAGGFPPANPTDILLDPIATPAGVPQPDVLVASTDNSAFRTSITPEASRGKGVIPVHKVIRAGPNSGRIVMVWEDMIDIGTPAQQDDVVTQYSDDNGATWSPPLVLHPAGPASWQFFPWIGTDRVTGHVYVGYYDTRRDGANNRAVDWMMTASADGVGGWTTPLRVAQAASDAGNAGNNDMLEYNGVAVWNGCVYTCWADNSNFTLDNPSGTLSPDGFCPLTSILMLDAD